MLEYKHIEEELDFFLSAVERGLEEVNKEKEILKIIEGKILKTEDNNSELKNKSISFKESKANLTQIENIDVNLKYFKFYEALNQIENEKQYLKKLDLINDIVS